MNRATSFSSWDDLPASGVGSALQAAGIEPADHVVPADAVLVESGTLVLAQGEGRP